MLNSGSSCALTWVVSCRLCGHVTSAVSATTTRAGAAKVGSPRRVISSPAAPVLQQIVERPFDRNLRPPSELVANSRGIAHHDRLIVGPVASRINLDLNADARACQQ